MSNVDVVNRVYAGFAAGASGNGAGGDGCERRDGAPKPT
jgi:hypothetical protein